MSTATATKERPIIMTGESVRAILDGRKTQTRRVVKPQPPTGVEMAMVGSHFDPDGNRMKYHAMTVGQAENTQFWTAPCLPGDRLWVKEPFRVVSFGGGTAEIFYEADARGRIVSSEGMPDRPRKVNPLYFPRSAHRLTLEVTDVQVEQVQYIVASDLVAECVPILSDDLSYDREREHYAKLWDDLNAKRGYPWDSNPWVWVITFKPEARR